ncbi:glycosyltransferase family 2 protein [Flavisphingomonas formosensis]|uniref:glycosyltransferase family 2 protein n=1 Tax=Flavisphingomonas formosensis TaxID=861534 RepID=UPI0012FBEA12|nr:glycosyltransferase [Sphingomonas formosensis]
MSPQVSVIIPHYNDLENLGHCLSLLNRQTLPPDSFEIVVADNNSACGLDAVRAVAGERAHVVPAPEQGAGAARNAAVAAARGTVLAFIDSDCSPRPDWLEKGLAGLRRGDMVGGAVQVFCQDAQRPNPIEAFEMVFAFRTRDYVERQRFAVTANLFTPRAIFDRVGGFRSVVAEDMDWCFRAGDLGYSLVYGEDAIVAHPARRTWDELTKKWRRTTRETYHLMAEKRLGRAKWVARSVAVLLSPLPHLAQVWRSRNIRGLAARTGASATLFRLRFFRFAEGLRLLRDGR